MSEIEILLRLAAGAAAGFLMGLERARRIEFVGGRTFGLIGLAAAAAAVITQAISGESPAGHAAALQGVLTGVGFIGAGVVLHPACRRNIRGVTTASAIWMAAVIGFAAGLGLWVLFIGAVALTGLLLVVPEPFQRRPAASPAPPPAEVCESAKPDRAA